jgi:hypothetical protein
MGTKSLSTPNGRPPQDHRAKRRHSGSRGGGPLYPAPLGLDRQEIVRLGSRIAGIEEPAGPTPKDHHGQGPEHGSRGGGPLCPLRWACIGGQPSRWAAPTLGSKPCCAPRATLELVPFGRGRWMDAHGDGERGPRLSRTDPGMFLLRSVGTLGRAGWPRNADSRLLNKFSNSFYGRRWPALGFGAMRDHTWGFDKLEVLRHGRS